MLLPSCCFGEIDHASYSTNDVERQLFCRGMVPAEATGNSGGICNRKAVRAERNRRSDGMLVSMDSIGCGKSFFKNL
jgi:hypothetical protein